MTQGVDEHVWSEASVNQLLDLVLLQGNRFIREFLRSTGLRLGTNKQQFEVRLRDAIADGQLTPADIQGWLLDIEGWGNQHLYSFEVPADAKESLRERSLVLERLAAAGLSDLLDAEIPLNPDAELALATVRHRADGVSFVWVRGSAALIRRKDLDCEKEVEGDEIEFHAYERRWSRVAARFELDFGRGLAAVLLTRSEDRDYAQQRDLVLATVGSVFPERANWPVLDISRVITQLDAAGLDAAEASTEQAGVRVNYTVFQGAAASIRMAAASQGSSYQDDAAVRQVRLAVDPGQFVGGAGDCYLTPTGSTEADRRELHLRFYGQEQRTLLWGKMTAEEVWGLIDDLWTYASA
jgi:hypothetical protein